MARRNNRRSGRQSGGSRWVDPGNPTGTKPPPFNPFRSATKEQDVVIEVINGKPTVVAVGGKPTYGPSGPTQSSGLAQNRPEPVAAPTAPPPTTPAPPKFDGYTPDSFYDEAMSTIAANRRRALDSATEGEKALAGDFGLGITQDDSGAKFTGQWAASDATRGGIDPSNPFSRASLLNKSYFVAGRMGEGSYANRGLLTSGAYQRNQQRDAFRFEQGRDQLLKQFASSLQGYRDRRAQAESDAETQRRQSSLDLYGRNRDNYDRMYPS